jgi:hypothetical protein
MIKKVTVNGKTKYRVVTHQTHRNMGTYGTIQQAEKRLKQIKRFK